MTSISTQEREAYSKYLLDTLNEMMGIEVLLRFDVPSPDTQYSYIEKNVVELEDVRVVRSATIGLNLQLLSTKLKVRKAIAHEFAHLFPGRQPHQERWKLWNSILSKVEQLRNASENC